MTTTAVKAFVYFAYTWLCGQLIPVAHFLAFTMLLVVADLITGTKAAKHRGEKIHSRGLGRSVNKIVLYCIGILLAHGMDQVFFAPKGLSFDLVWLVAGLISLTEFKSNLENIASVTGVDVWKGIADLIPRLPLPKKDEPKKDA